MKKKWIWIGLAVVLVVIVIAANLVRGSGGRVVSVQFARVRREDITSRVRAPGKIEPRTQVKVSADIPGKVVILAVKEGDRVRIDFPNRKIDIQVPETELAARKLEWHPAQRPLTGWLARYRKLVTNASQGGILVG